MGIYVVRYLLKRKIEIIYGNKIKYSENQLHSLKHQMSSQSATARRASTSYTAGIPGSQVTLIIGKDGNRSLKLSRGAAVPVPVPDRRFPDGWVGPANMPFCKVCYDAGLPVADYTDHFVKDQPGPDGKVVCPTLLAQKCLNCGVPGHTSNYCPEKLRAERERFERENKERELSRKAVSTGQAWATVGQKGTTDTAKKPRIEDMNPEKTQQSKSTAATVVAVPRKTYGGSFGVLGVDDSSSEDERQAEIQNTAPLVSAPSAAITNPAKPLTWAQRAAAVARKPAPTVVAPPPANVRMAADTRFQLHAALCDNIEVDKRSAMVASKRAAAAAVATESARKRKQDSATVPA